MKYSGDPISLSDPTYPEFLSVFCIWVWECLKVSPRTWFWALISFPPAKSAFDIARKRRATRHHPHSHHLTSFMT
jgi:hypothetical protein